MLHQLQNQNKKENNTNYYIYAKNNFINNIKLIGYPTQCISSFLKFIRIVHIVCFIRNEYIHFEYNIRNECIHFEYNT